VIYIKKNSQLVVIKSWCNNPEDGAVEQAVNLASLPFTFKQVCLMPDAHCGYGVPIGGVFATKDYVVPNSVGVDIGCGCSAVKTSLHVEDLPISTLKIIMGKVRSEIPVGFNHHTKKQDENLMPCVEKSETVFNLPVISKEYQNALYSLGTLGGGNHFIEFQKCVTDNSIWIMIHSGSRNLGKQVADHYNKEAVKLNEKYFCKIPKEWELAFITIEDHIGHLYLQEMSYCINYALANRSLMMRIIEDKIQEVIPDTSFEPVIDIAHNYASFEFHFGTNVLVHRKGATLATKETIGIIPGSQGTKSYIIQGKGNPESFNSCSHGAGRKMGRGVAIRTLNLEDEKRKLDEKGIVHSIRNNKDLDEASGAYKDIDIVINEQLDLIEIIHELEPIGVIKG
jgi:tRNA-splicing ligase RtcB